MSKRMKKMLAAMLSMAMVLTPLPNTVPSVVEAASTGRVTVIVQMEQNAVFSVKGIAQQTKKAKKKGKKVLAAQSLVQEKMEKTIENPEFGFSYTNVFNGFSAEIDAADITKVKAIDGVKAVYLSETHRVEEALTTDRDNDAGTGIEADVENCCEMMSVDDMHENGYTGEGKVVAVIDSELDVNHEMFSGDIQNPKYSKSDIKTLIQEKELNASVSANQVYRSEKIPYAYNYSTRNADVYSQDGSFHGTHVAGIAVGNAGRTPDGDTFTGVAPSAQLCFFAIPDFEDDAVLAALDDAAKMDVDVVNCSWGATYCGTTIYEEAMSNLENAGISVYVAACNEGTGTDALTLLTTDVDDSSGGQPQGLNSVSSVASADATSHWATYYNLTVSGEKISYYLKGKHDFAETFSDKEYEYVFCGYGQESDFAHGDVADKIAVYYVANPDGVDLKCSQKEEFASQAGAVGVILINDDDDISQKRIYNLALLPTALVSQSSGDILEQAENKMIMTNQEKQQVKEEYSDGQISEFSSWGTNSTLELKPDITAVGGQIYSSIGDDEYATYDGTSMATPHMSGAWVLLEQLLEEKYGDVDNALNVQKNLMMSSADIVYQDAKKTIPYSPRNQGAGLLNLKAASETPVYLVGTSGKSSISLKDQLEDTFTLSFTAKNLTDKDVTYDSISLYAMTDDYKEDSGRYVKANKMKSLSYTCDLPDSVTVPASGEKEITLTVKLDSKETKKNLEIFSNGFFMDGYVVLDSKDSSHPQISIPYTGFYGDWTTTSILDGKMYDGDYRLTGTYLVTTSSEDTESDEFIIYPLGVNYSRSNEEYLREEYAGISPNGDGIFDDIGIYTTPFRDIASLYWEIRDAEGEVVSTASPDDLYPAKYDTVYDIKRYSSSTDKDDIPTEEGEYTLTLSAELNYEREKTDTITMNFYVDVTKPNINDIQMVQENGNTYLKVQASDNKYLMNLMLYDTESEGENHSDIVCFEPGESGTVSLDVTGLDLSEYSVEVTDYAGNVTTGKVLDLLPSETPEVAQTPNPTAGTVSPVQKPVSAKPGRVKIKSVKSNKKKTITIRWSKTKNAKKYEICYAVDKKFKLKKRKTTGKLFCTLKKLKKGTTYYIRLRALNGKKTGKWSRVKKVKLLE